MLNLVSYSSGAMPPLDMAYRMLRAVIDVAANAEMDTVSVVPVTAVTPVPPVVNNINLSAGNSDGSNWWHAYGESGAQSLGNPPYKALPDGESGGNAWAHSTWYPSPDGDSSYSSGHRKSIEDQ